MEPRLCIESEFAMDGRHSRYDVSFYNTKIRVIDKKEQGENYDIHYTELKKILMGKDKIKLVRNDKSVLEIPYSKEDVSVLKEIFQENIEEGSVGVSGVALVNFGGIYFIIRVDSSNYKKFKSAVIRRIGRFFYPTFSRSNISLDLFKGFTIYLVLEGRLVVIQNSEDLEAALIYNDYKIEINIDVLQE